MKHLKSLALFAAISTGFAAHSFAQTLTQLELVNPLTDTSVVTISPGGSFSLNIEIAGLPTVPALDSFDVTVSGSTTSTTAFATGISLASFSNLATGFFGAQGGSSNPQYFGAIALSTSSDIAFSPVPTTILTANFTTSNALATGSYTINFPPTGSFQNLYDADSDAISYNPVDATILVVPEPGMASLLLVGFSVLAGFRLLSPFFRRA